MLACNRMSNFSSGAFVHYLFNAPVQTGRRVVDRGKIDLIVLIRHLKFLIYIYKRFQLDFLDDSMEPK